MARKRIGMRRHYAAFYRHNGNIDANGNPTISNQGDWNKYIAAWPCELLTTSGGEVIRGRQVAAETTHLLYGDYRQVKDVRPQHQIRINGQTLSITAVMDTDGLQREMRVEAKQEVD